MNISEEKKKEIFFSMLRIRRVEERIESLYLNDEMKTPVHLCIGQEAIAVGVCTVLDKHDFISSNHRGHGHYLAKGGNLDAMIAELHCKTTGCSKGFGGSMHLIDVSVGHMGSSSIVGGGIPIGTGLGLAIKLKKKKFVSCIFFGDGAADEGVLYESINFAMLKKLPVIFILENNQWSVCSHVSSRQVGDNVFFKGASPENLFVDRIDGNDVLKVCQIASKAVKRARSGMGPSFVQCDTYRILGHAGCFSQDANGYRDINEVKFWKKRCPVTRLQKILFDEGTLNSDDLLYFEKIITSEIDSAFNFAQKSSLPSSDDLNNFLYKD